MRSVVRVVGTGDAFLHCATAVGPRLLVTVHHDHEIGRTPTIEYENKLWECEVVLALPGVDAVFLKPNFEKGSFFKQWFPLRADPPQIAEKIRICHFIENGSQVQAPSEIAGRDITRPWVARLALRTVDGSCGGGIFSGASQVLGIHMHAGMNHQSRETNSPSSSDEAGEIPATKKARTKAADAMQLQIDELKAQLDKLRQERLLHHIIIDR